MKNNNKVYREELERLANKFLKEKNHFKKEVIFRQIFISMEKYISVCATNAVRKAAEYYLDIPKVDFISAYNLALWESIESFKPAKGSIHSLISYRFSIAEASVWRQYEIKDEKEKNGRSFIKARWNYLDNILKQYSESESEQSLSEMLLGKVPSAESTYIEKNNVIEILESFAQKNERYMKVISLIYEGYKGNDLAVAMGEGKKYNTNVRKLVQRAKNSFKKFLIEKEIV